MPEYHFTGAYPRLLTGLSVGVNAAITKADGTVPAHGSTVEGSLGDVIDTTEPYEHADLTPVDTAPEAPEAPVPAPEPAPAPAPEAPAPVAPALGFDPAHDAMTAEGAPAPAAPTA